MPTLRDSIEKTQNAISAKLASLSRPADDCTLIAVTKTHPVEAIEEALRAGIRHFGENKVQEAQRKIPFIREPYNGFHFIGHLQSNKINALLELKPSLIHSIDSVYLAQKLDHALARFNRVQDILVQVNTTSEDSKSGVIFANALDTVPQIAAFPRLKIRGLMTIGMMSIDAERTRPYFRMLRELFEQLAAMNDPSIEMRWLSMGMSDDWKVALEEGSNMLRLGTALFGSREYGGTR
jgi:pyridoxal phosphate enzyme (YggS family)